MDVLNFDLAALLQRVREASLELAHTKSQERDRGLQILADCLKAQQNAILEANTLDLEASREMAIPDIVLGWLKLTPERLQTTVRILQQLAGLPDPLEQRISSAYHLDHAQTYCQRVPLGSIALVYEAFPELAMIAAGICLKTGNSLILRGGSEASHTNSSLAQLFQITLEEARLPQGALEALPADRAVSIKELVSQDQVINLVIPYGRPSLVQQVVRQATMPVLRMAMGNCYLFWSASGSGEVARLMILDSHQGSPDPVNAIEKVLLHPNLNRSLLMVLWNSLKERGFELRGGCRIGG